MTRPTLFLLSFMLATAANADPFIHASGEGSGPVSCNNVPYGSYSSQVRVLLRITDPAQLPLTLTGSTLHTIKRNTKRNVDSKATLYIVNEARGPGVLQLNRSFTGESTSTFAAFAVPLMLGDEVTLDGGCLGRGFIWYAADLFGDQPTGE